MFTHSGHVLNEDRLTVSEYWAAAAQPAASLKTSTQYSVAAKLRLAATGWWRGAALGRWEKVCEVWFCMKPDVKTLLAPCLNWECSLWLKCSDGCHNLAQDSSRAYGLAWTCIYLCSIRVRGNRCDRAADLELVWLLRNILTHFTLVWLYRFSRISSPRD